MNEAVEPFKPRDDEELDDLERLVDSLETPFVKGYDFAKVLSELLDSTDPKQRRAFQIAFMMVGDFSAIANNPARNIAPTPKRTRGQVVQFTRRPEGRAKDWDPS